jgi:hypothetical protein
MIREVYCGISAGERRRHAPQFMFNLACYSGLSAYDSVDMRSSAYFIAFVCVKGIAHMVPSGNISRTIQK